MKIILTDRRDVASGNEGDGVDAHVKATLVGKEHVADRRTSKAKRHSAKQAIQTTECDQLAIRL